MSVPRWEGRPGDSGRWRGQNSDSDSEFSETEVEDEVEVEEVEKTARLSVRQQLEEIIAVDIKLSASVQDLKWKIYREFSMDVDEMLLDFAGVPLRNDQPLCAYNIQADDDLHFMQNNKERYRSFIHFFVKTPTEILPMYLSKYCLLKKLKQKIFELSGIAVNQQRIIFDGRLRTDTLEHVTTYGRGSTVELFIPQIMKVTICTISDKKEYPLWIEDFNTGAEVKRKIFDLLHIIPSAQRILIGNLLVEDDILMRDYEIRDQSVLNVHENTDSGTTIKFTIKMSSGERIDLERNRLNSIYSLKQHIQEHKGIPCEKQRLFRKDSELLDWQSLAEANVLNGYEIDVYLRSKVKIFINVFQRRDVLIKTHTLDIDLRDTISDLSKSIEEEFGIPTERQYLSFEEMTLYEKHHTLAYQGIGSGDSIDLTLL